MSSEEPGSKADPLVDAIDVGSRDGFVIDVQHPAASVVLLRVEGKLDLWTSLPLLDAILTAFHEYPELIAVDVSGVPSADKTGLNTLVQASGHVEEARVRFAVVCPAGSEVALLLERTDGHRALNVHQSVEDALGQWLDAAGEILDD